MLKIAPAAIVAAVLAVSAVQAASAQSFAPAVSQSAPSVRGTVVRLRLATPATTSPAVEAAREMAESVEVAVKLSNGDLYFAYVDQAHQPAVGDTVKLAVAGNHVRIVD
ncbi:hypothetical protein [Burkholderia sp. Ac-20365]|uniref:hypothetical protein n=1 Tax=Burkholderia sp. Ac-20365 TaxID=2703897 RepID=UPI00197BE4B4|nr:hypothetical protein [Burkholderia sp. Ac-20365]MBN3760939.1 hypothetical protein [Burkholderia sp. Ac-20365]